MRPLAVMAGLMPEGPVPTTVISDSVTAMLGDHWPAQSLWIAAVRLDDARLVVFGRADAPDATPAEAVAASCAIPGWFAPVRIGGSRYVDGGVHSLTNVNRLARADLDLVIVSAPMGRAGRRGYNGAFRQAARAQLTMEAEVLRRRGVSVVAFQPTVADQAVMGPDAMDASRRAAVVQQVRTSTLARLGRPDVARRLDVLLHT
jgi:NTE family protein